MHRFKQLENSLFIGPQPTPQDLQQAKEHGIKTVIDFRPPAEAGHQNEDLTTRYGLEYVNIPVNKACLDVNLIDALDRAMEEKEGPFLIHCAGGARAALLLCLSRAKKNQWSAERTFEEARAMGFDIQGAPEFRTFVMEVTDGYHAGANGAQ